MALMVRLAMAATAAWMFAGAAAAAPLLLIDGSDQSVVVLDLGTRDRTGDVRRASLYRGVIAEGSAARRVSGERREFDCPGRRERLVAILSPGIAGKAVETPAAGPWATIAWNTPMDYAAVAVCLSIYNRDRVSAKTDVPSMLEALENVLRPGGFQPPPQPAARQERRRSWWRPF